MTCTILTKTVFSLHFLGSMNSLNTGLNNGPIFLFVRAGSLVCMTYKLSLKQGLATHQKAAAMQHGKTDQSFMSQKEKKNYY